MNMNRYAWSHLWMLDGKGSGQQPSHEMKNGKSKCRIIAEQHLHIEWLSVDTIECTFHIFFSPSHCSFMCSKMIAISTCEWYKSICTIKCHSKMLLSVHVVYKYKCWEREKEVCVYVRKRANNNSPRNNWK